VLAGGELALATIQEAVAEVVPERPAVVWGEAGVTHGELTTRSRRFAATLLSSGASSGKVSSDNAEVDAVDGSG
jgi:hypothetical protein